MAEDRGSGFGKLVFGVVAGNGYDTEGMTFKQAVKIFEKLGGEENWKAKDLKMEAEEKEKKTDVNEKINAKATADEIVKNPNSSDFEKNLYKGVKEDINKEEIKANKKDEIEEMRAKIKAMDLNDPQRTELLNRVHKLEDEEKLKTQLEEAKKQFPKGTTFHDLEKREWFEVVGYSENGYVTLKGNAGTRRSMKIDMLKDLKIDSKVYPRNQETRENDFWGRERGSEEADNLLFGFQVLYGNPNLTYDDVEKKSHRKGDLELAKEYSKRYNKDTFFKSEYDTKYELPRTKMNQFLRDYKGYDKKEFDIEQLVKDNDLLNDEDLESYHQKQWGNAKAKDFKIDQSKVDNMMTSDIPYVTEKKDGSYQLGDGRHRVRALYNSGYKTIVLPYKREK